MNFSGSRTHLLLTCPPAGALPWLETTSVWSEEGQAVHAFLERVALHLAHAKTELRELRAMSGKTDLDVARESALEDVAETHRARCASLDLEAVQDFLRPGAFLREVALALAPASGAAKRLAPKGHRDYSGLDRSRWMPLTLDLAGEADGVLVVADWKGRRPDPEQARLQCATGALTLMRVLEQERRAEFIEGAVLVAIVLDDDGEPRQRRWTMTRAELEAHGDRLADAWERSAKAREAYAAGGWVALVPHLRAGEHCKRCPALRFCPSLAVSAAALARGDVLPGQVGDARADAAVAYGLLQAVRARVEADLEAISALAAEEPLQLPDGRVLGPCPEEKIDPDAGQEVLRQLWGMEWAAAAGVRKVTMPWDRVEACAKDYLGPDRKRGAVKAEMSRVRKAFREAGAVKVTQKVRAYEPKEDET